MGDFNGDGRADFVFGAGLSGARYSQYWVCLTNATGTGLVSCAQVPLLPGTLPGGGPTYPSAPRSFAVYGDFNGDGRVDVAFFLDGVPGDVYRYCLSSSTSTAVQFACYDAQGPRSVDGGLEGADASGDRDVVVADVNGDGRADFIQRKNDGSQTREWRVCLSRWGEAGLSFSNALSCSNAWLQLTTGEVSKLGVFDFNGDGMADFAAPMQPSEPGYVDGRWRVCLARGDGSFYDAPAASCETYWNGPTGTPNSTDMNKLYFGDFDGDGRTDFAIPLTANLKWRVCLSAGVDFVCTNGGSRPDWDGPGVSPTQGAFDRATKIADLNGDGRSDIITFNNGATAFKTTGPTANRIEHIINGLSARIDVAYRSLTDPTTPAVYSRGTVTAASNELVIQSPMYVVSSHSASDGNGGGVLVTTSYSYTGLKGRSDGRGLLGFNQRRVVDINGVETITTFEQTWPRHGMTASIEKRAPAAGGPMRLVNRVTNLYETTPVSESIGSVYRTVQKQSEQESWELNNWADPGTKLPRTRTDMTGWDSFGNVGTVVVTTYDGPSGGAGHVKTTVNNYVNETTQWLLGRLTASMVTSQAPADPATSVRKSEFSYYCLPGPDCGVDPPSARGQLRSETIEPDCYNAAGGCIDRSQGQRTSYTYDAFGNKSSSLVQFYEGSTLKQREARVTYDASGRFPILIDKIGDPSAPIDIRERMLHDARFGGVRAKSAPDRIQTYSEHDGFGRPVRSSVCKVSNPDPAIELCSPNTPNGLLSQTSRTMEAAGLAAGEVYRIVERTSGAPEKRVYFDQLQRERRIEVRNFANSGFVESRTAYDSLGRKASETRPYASTGGASVSRTTAYQYDVLNRLELETRPIGTVRTSYFVVSHTDAAGGGVVANRAKIETRRSNTTGEEVTSRVVNSQNQVVEAVEANGKSTTNAYDAAGNLICVTPSSFAPATRRCKADATRSGYQIATEFDQRGRKVKMADPDMGTWTYAYSGVGELLQQTDANGAVSSQTYDSLGRLVQRVEQRGATTFQSTWTFDDITSCSTVSLVKTGKLCRNAVTAGAAKSLEYDQYGRLYKTVTDIRDVASVVRSFDAYTLFDNRNRPAYTGYPQVDATTPRYAVRQTFNAAGYASQVGEATNPAVVHWAATSRYDDGQPYQTSIGGVGEARGYDGLGRIASIVSGLLQNATFSFDHLGNLTSRRDQRGDGLTYDESFAYDEIHRVKQVTCNVATLCGTSRTFQYDDFGNLRNKAGLILTPTTNTHRLQSAGARSYQYDAAGNVLTDGTTSVTWTPFNYPDYLTSGGGRIDLRYDADHERTVESGSNGTLTLYVGRQFFEVSIQGATTTGKAYLATPDGIVGVVTQSTANALGRRYWYRDHLGSIVAERDSATAQTVYLGYDEWGARRGSFVPTSTATARGFTGHEHLDTPFTLVHMNGRIYDPVAGRFVSADPIIQDATNPQSFNRYAYVYNNPLSFTDPHGFSAWSQWIRPVVITVATWYVLGPGGAFGASGVFGAVGGSAGLFGSTLANGFASAAAAGFAAGGIQGGNIESAVYGAFSAVAFYGVGQSATFLADKYGTAFWGSGSPGRVVLHGAAGCASASVAGGSCGHGAISAAFAEAAGPNVSSVTGGNKVAGFVGAIVAGGAAARLAGGKFANGAATGAFSYLFNSLAHPTNTLEAGVRQAILRGDVGELRVLLGEANLTANDMAMAQRALSAMENLSGQEARMLAKRYGLDFANKIGHAFGKELHNLDTLVRTFGSPERAFVQIQNQVDALSLSAGPFTRVLTIDSVNVTIRGFVQNGIAKIGTVFVP